MPRCRSRSARVVPPRVQEYTDLAEHGAQGLAFLDVAQRRGGGVGVDDVDVARGEEAAHVRELHRNTSASAATVCRKICSNGGTAARWVLTTLSC